jgi:hypothetical protein
MGSHIVCKIFLLKIEVLEFIYWMYLFKTLHRPEDGSLEPKHVVKLCIINYILCCVCIHHFMNIVASSWNVMAQGEPREGKWRGNWRMVWVASTLHTTSEHGVSSIITADAHTSAASSRLNWRPRRFKWTRPFGRKTKSGFCACAITFQLAYKLNGMASI